MSHSRLVSDIIADVRLRADIQTATTRHTDASLLRFVVESWQTLRALLTDSGSTRFLLPVEVTVVPSQTVTGTIQWTVAVDAGTSYDSVHTVYWQSNGTWYELVRRGAQELLDNSLSLTGGAYPTGWCLIGSTDTAAGTQDSRSIIISPWTGTAPGSITVRMLVVPSMATVTSTTVLQIEEYGFDWLINHVVLKVLQRDNDAQDRMGITQALFTDAEKRLLATIRRESSPATKRRQVQAARSRRRYW